MGQATVRLTGLRGAEAKDAAVSVTSWTPGARSGDTHPTGSRRAGVRQRGRCLPRMSGWGESRLQRSEATRPPETSGQQGLPASPTAGVLSPWGTNQEPEKSSWSLGSVWCLVDSPASWLLSGQEPILASAQLPSQLLLLPGRAGEAAAAGQRSESRPAGPGASPPPASHTQAAPTLRD